MALSCRRTALHGGGAVTVGPPKRFAGSSPHQTRRLIVNADDLGLAPGVTEGILELAALGVVTSTSVLVNLPSSQAAWQSVGGSGLDAGLHLNMVSGQPLSPPRLVPSLLNADGRFPLARVAMARLLRGQLSMAEVEREWRAQIELYLSTGLPLTHLDSHCQMHMYPRLAGLTLRLAHIYGVPAVRRLASGFVLQLPGQPRARLTLNLPDRAVSPLISARGLYFTDRFTVLTVLGHRRPQAALRALLTALPASVTELICHPGYADDELRGLDTLIAEREHEARLLASPFFRDLLAELNIGLTTYRDEVAAARPRL